MSTNDRSTFATVIASNRLEKLNPKTTKALSHKNSHLVFIKQGKLKKTTGSYHQHTNLFLKEENASIARNLGLKHVFKNLPDLKYIGFTDDDCIVNKNWVENMNKTYDKENADLVFGKTIPYFPHSKPNFICPAIFEKKSSSKDLIKTHWKYIGLGNNWSVKKEVFNKIGTFKPWLGPGGIGQSGEEVEFIIRCSIAGLNIRYNEKCLVMHDKWIPKNEARKQAFAYTCGEIAAYGFYAFQGVRECWPIIFTKLGFSKLQMKQDLKKIIKNPKKNGRHAYLLIQEIVSILRGFFVAFLYAYIIPIPEKENVVKKIY